MPQCRQITTRQGGPLKIRYPGVTGAWLDSGQTVPSGTVGVAIQEADGPFALESGATVAGFVEMEWPDSAEIVGRASGWVASDYTKIVPCTPQVVAPKKSSLYFDPASDPHDRPLTSKSSFLPMLAFLTVGYFLLFK
jgi:hypothetical protein